MHFQPGIYGNDTTAIPGHDHIGDPPGGADFNIAWEVWVVVFTPAGRDYYGGVENLPHLTTDAAIQAAADAGYVEIHDLGFAFNCSVVPAKTYWKGQPIGG